MNLASWLLLVVTATALTALTWWTCAWWYGRKLGELRQRLEKTRQAASALVTQARQQIAQLQKELSERPPLSAPQRQARDAAADAARRKAELAATLDAEATIRLPRSGFADTQPMM